MAIRIQKKSQIDEYLSKASKIINLTRAPNFVSEETVPDCKYIEEGTTAVQREIIFLAWKRDSPPPHHDSDKMGKIC